MQPIQHFSSTVLAEIIRRQPASNERTQFVWQLAVGPALARVTSIELVGTTLVVRGADKRWLRELERARDMILSRLQHMLGRDAITALQFSPLQDTAEKST